MYNINLDKSVLPDFVSTRDMITIPVFENGEFREMVKPYSDQFYNSKDFYYVKVNIRRSAFSNDVIRKYEKIDDLLAYLGGFVATLIASIGAGLAFIKKKIF